MQRVRPEEGAVGGPKWEFGGGDPRLGIESTIISHTWLNGVQNEVVNAVEGSGQLLQADDQTQLKKAILRAADQIVVGPGGHYEWLSDALQHVKPHSSILVVSDSKLTAPLKVTEEFVSISFRWGTRLVRDPAMTDDFIFDVSKDGFRLSGLNAEGFKHLVRFSEPPPQFAFIRTTTLKGGTTAVIGGTPLYLDLSSVVILL